LLTSGSILIGLTELSKRYPYRSFHLDLLCARTVEWEQEMFVPAGADDPISVEATTSWQTSIENDIERHFPSISGMSYCSLTDAWEAGLARPVYPTTKKKFTEADHVSFKTPESYVFRFEDLVIPVDADVFTAMRELGFHAQVPTARYGDYPRPCVGLSHSESPQEFFGVMDMMRDSSLRDSDDGRDMFLDPAIACWLSPDEALHLLSRVLPCEEKPPRTVEDVLRWGAVPPREFGMGLSTMRWKGLSDDEINEAFTVGTWDFWNQRHAKLLERASSLLSQLRERPPSPKGWEYSHITSESRKLVKHFSWLEGALETSLDPGEIPSLIRLIEET